MGFLFVFWNKYRETYFEASQITKWTLVQLVITSVQTKAWAEKEISSKICSYPVCLVKSSLDKEGGGWLGGVGEGSQLPEASGLGNLTNAYA